VSEEPSEVLAEWRVRRVAPPGRDPVETYGERVDRWLLYSLGVEGVAQDVYLYLRSRREATLEEVAKRFSLDEEKARACMEELYTAGLINMLGKMFYVEEQASQAIVGRLIPRLTQVLKEIARVEADAKAKGFFRW